MPLILAQYLEPPRRVVRFDQVDTLRESMLKHGWLGVPLIGYMHNDRVQLLSGTHRRAAALSLGLLVPVKIYPRDIIENYWGNLPEWERLMKGLV